MLSFAHLYSPAGCPGNWGQWHGLRSLLQGKMISCSIWNNIVQIKFNWNNHNDLVSNQVTGKPKRVCSKGVHIQYSCFSSSDFYGYISFTSLCAISSHLNTCSHTSSPVKNNLMTFERYWRKFPLNNVWSGRVVGMLPCSGAAEERFSWRI